jgi:hypothetical protein
MRTALSFIPVAIALGSTLGCGCGTRSTTGDAPAEAPARNAERNYRKLVEGLVSPNRSFRIVDKDDSTAAISIPPNYDWEAQKRIDENRKLLSAHVEEALPFLVEGCTDSRYSLSQRWAEDYVINSSVGDVCGDVIARYVEVFREYMSFSDPVEWHQYNFVPHLSKTIDPHVNGMQEKEFRDWWRQRKDKSLRDLQIEAFDWAIEKRRKRYGQFKDSEQPGDLKGLTAARDKLSRDTTYLPPQHCGISQAFVSPPKEPRVLPWTERQQRQEHRRYTDTHK